MSISLAQPPQPDRPAPADAVDKMLRDLDAVFDDRPEPATWSLSDRHVPVRLEAALAVRARLDQLVARLVGEVATRSLAEAHGAASTKGYLMADHRMSSRAAADSVAAACSMTHRTESTRRAWATGLVSAEQAVVIAAAVAQLDAALPGQVVTEAQVDLIEHARTLTHTQLRVAASHLVEVVDPDSADQALGEQLEADETRALQQAVFRGRRGADGVASFSGRLPNLQYDMLTTALDAIASPRRNQLGDLAGFGGSMAPDPESTAVAIAVTAPGGTRAEQLPFASRRGRAFCELVEHLPTTALPQHGVGNATIVVTVEDQQLRTGVGAATLTTGTRISAGEARRLACNAGILPLVLGADSAVLDLGRTRRLFDRYQRLALAVRDRGCIFRGCDRPPAWTEAHHSLSWQDGGSSALENGCLLCSFHHHLVHAGEWSVEMAADGIPEVLPPIRLDPRRRPIRHERFKPRPG